MSDKILTATAPGKLILLGEYAVLHGAPALVMAVDRFARVAIFSPEGAAFQVSAPTLGISRIPFEITPSGGVKYPSRLSREDRERLRFFTTALETVAGKANEAGVAVPPAHIVLDTEEFFHGHTKLGLGSSAALTVALIGALLNHAGVTPPSDREEEFVLRLAREIHRRAQGQLGSGIDIAAGVYGGVLQYRLSSAGELPEVRRLSFPEGLSVQAVWSGRAASTTEMVARVEQFHRREPSAFASLMEAMTAVAQRGCEVFAQNRVGEFLKWVEEYRQLLDRLGQASGAPIVSAVHRRLAQQVRSRGATYKPSGAGGGDFGFIFADSPEQMQQAVAAVEQAGFAVFDFHLAGKGMVVERTG